MAKVFHVKKARNRYETVDTGERIPVIEKDGQQKKTKNDDLVFRKKTVIDYSKPKPPFICNACSKPIEVGQSYKWVEIKTAVTEKKIEYRCETCPDWFSWELSSNVFSRCDEVEHFGLLALDQCTNSVEVREVFAQTSKTISSIVTNYLTAAQTMDAGFGHETGVSRNHRANAAILNDWASALNRLADLQSLPPRPRDEHEIEVWHQNARDLFTAVFVDRPKLKTKTRSEKKSEVSLDTAETTD